MSAVPQAPDTAPNYAFDEYGGEPAGPIDPETAVGLLASQQNMRRVGSYVVAVVMGSVATVGLGMTGALAKAAEVGGKIGDVIHDAADTIGAPVGRALDRAQALGAHGAQATQGIYHEGVGHWPLIFQLGLGAIAVVGLVGCVMVDHRRLGASRLVRPQSRGRVAIMPDNFTTPKARNMATQLASPVRAQQGCPTQPDANLASQDNPRRTVQLPIAP